MCCSGCMHAAYAAWQAVASTRQAVAADALAQICDAKSFTSVIACLVSVSAFFSRFCARAVWRREARQNPLKQDDPKIQPRITDTDRFTSIEQPVWPARQRVYRFITMLYSDDRPHGCSVWACEKTSYQLQSCLKGSRRSLWLSFNVVTPGTSLSLVRSWGAVSQCI